MPSPWGPFHKFHRSDSGRLLQSEESSSSSSPSASADAAGSGDGFVAAAPAPSSFLDAAAITATAEVDSAARAEKDGEKDQGADVLRARFAGLTNGGKQDEILAAQHEQEVAVGAVVPSPAAAAPAMAAAPVVTAKEEEEEEEEEALVAETTAELEAELKAELEAEARELRAAVTLQRCFRGFASRRLAQVRREEEYEALRMEILNEEAAVLQRAWRARQRRVDETRREAVFREID